jgi:hypothetical protein
MSKTAPRRAALKCDVRAKCRPGRIAVKTKSGQSHSRSGWISLIGEEWL